MAVLETEKKEWLRPREIVDDSHEEPAAFSRVHLDASGKWTVFRRSGASRPTQEISYAAPARWVSHSADPLVVFMTGICVVDLKLLVGSELRRAYTPAHSAVLVVHRVEKQLPKWINKWRDVDDSEIGQKDLSDVLVELNKCFANRDFAKLNELMQGLEPERYAVKILLTLARGTFAARIALPNWSNAIRAYKDEVESRGLDADQLFKGL
jgi:hypothetical protein